MTEYEVIRSRRKTLALEVRGSRVLVRAPYRTSERYIKSFVQKHEDWIRKKLALSRTSAQVAPEEKLSMADIRKLAEQAKSVIPERVQYYAGLIGVNYGRITIRNQKTRWGSCSAKGNLNFNCLLMLAPSEVLDSVIVHELCHRKEMNHSEKFYREVYRVFPDYDRCRKWLKTNGRQIMARAQQDQ